MSESGMHGMPPASQRVSERGLCDREPELRKWYCHNVCVNERTGKEERCEEGEEGKKEKEKEGFRTEPHSMSSSRYEVVCLVC